MIETRAIYLCLAIGLTQAAMGCSDLDTSSKPVEAREAISAETEPTNETAQVEAPSPSAEITSVSRTAESHVHGGATLSVVSENGAVAMEFETPLYNLIGFEYAPQSDEEKARVSDVEKRLSQPDTLFRLNAEARCTYGTKDEAISLFPKEAENHTDHHGHEKQDKAHDHHSHHDEDEHETEDKPDTEEGHDHDSAHAEIILNYAADCQNLDKLETIEVLFFQDFPNMTDVELVYLGPSQQMGAELSPSNPTADLTR